MAGKESKQQGENILALGSYSNTYNVAPTDRVGITVNQDYLNVTAILNHVSGTQSYGVEMYIYRYGNGWEFVDSAVRYWPSSEKYLTQVFENIAVKDAHMKLTCKFLIDGVWVTTQELTFTR